MDPFGKLLDRLPVELHVPGYQFCGPGTHLQQRLQRGDVGINPLDRACRVHDIAYASSSAPHDRLHADKVLADAASKRIKASDASFAERIAAILVLGAMVSKTILSRVVGGGRKRKRAVKKRGCGVKKRKRSTTATTQRRGCGRTCKKGTRRQRRLPLPKKTGGFLPFMIGPLPTLAARIKAKKEGRPIPPPDIVPDFYGLQRIQNQLQARYEGKLAKYKAAQKRQQLPRGSKVAVSYL